MKDHLRNVHKISQQNVDVVAKQTPAEEPPCSSMAARQPSLLESFQTVTDFGAEGQKTKKINEAIIYMIAKDVQPFSVVENPGFIYLMNTVAPRYEIPSRYKITKWVDEKYTAMKEIWITRLEGKTLTLTMDVWSDEMSMRSFLGITAHFLLEKKMDSVTLGVLELSERHTASYLSEMLESCCSDWRIEKQQVTAIVTDNAANVVKAVEIGFGRKKHLPCFAHTLNLIARSAMQRESVNGCITKVKSIVTFFKQSCVASDQLRKMTDKVLIQDVATRWNSTFYMIKRFLELKTYVSEVLFNIRNEMTMLNGNELELLNNIVTMLHPLEEATKIISGEKYCTASMVIPIVSILKDKLLNINGDTLEAKDVKDFLLLEIDRRMGSVEQVSILAMATMLDPRFKKLHFKDPQACANAIIKIKSQTKPNENDVENLPPNTPNNSSSFWDHHYQLAQSHTPSMDIDVEMSAYLRMPLTPFESDPIEAWEGMKNTYPNLHQVALQLLPVVGSSVPSERVFSAAANVLTRKRNRLTPDRLSRILFLQSIDKKYFF